MDVDLLNAIKADPQKFREAMATGQPGEKLALMMAAAGTDQYSSKSYLTGEPLPKNLSKGLIESQESYRKTLKDAKKGKIVTARLSVNLLKPEIRAKMHNDAEFCEKR